MDRIHDTLRLENDGMAFLGRVLVRAAWGMATVSPGDVYLSRKGSRIDSDDSALDSDQGLGPLEGLRDWLDKQDAASLFVVGFRFQDDDQETPNWYPQGLSGTADADASGKVDGKKFLLVAWYHKTNDEDDEPMARISLINVSDIQDIEYRHLLLVEPITDDDGNPSFKAVKSHRGGLVWFGRWLYVASNDELLVFDMESITDIKAQNADYDDSERVGYYGGKYHAAGYRYIVPLVSVYTIDDSDRGNYFDTLGLDRSTDPPRIVAAGYVSEDSEAYDTEISHAVVVFFDLNDSTGLLANSGSYFEASDVAYSGAYYVQGVHACGDHVWLCQGQRVDLLLHLEIGHDGGDEYYWAHGGEGLTYAASTDHLWNVTEVEGSRICFCVMRNDVW